MKVRRHRSEHLNKIGTIASTTYSPRHKSEQHHDAEDPSTPTPHRHRSEHHRSSAFSSNRTKSSSRRHRSEHHNAKDPSSTPSPRRHQSDNNAKDRSSTPAPHRHRSEHHNAKDPSSTPSPRRHRSDHHNAKDPSSTPSPRRYRSEHHNAKDPSSTPSTRRYQSEHYRRHSSDHRSKHRSPDVNNDSLYSDDESSGDINRCASNNTVTTTISSGRVEGPSLWVDGVPRVCAPFYNMQLNGGPGSLNNGEYRATKELKEMIECFREEIILKAVTKGHTFSADIEALSYKTQVVAGTNYFIKVRIGAEYCHVCIYRSPEGKIRFAGMEPKMALVDEIRYMICIRV